MENVQSVESVAKFLIGEKLLLTALELHTELMHRGIEQATLRDFFNNPGNFEQIQTIEACGPTLPRTSSVQTLESLDISRHSEDGEMVLSEKVAVLEFELRKAKDAIRSLRNNLAVVTENKPGSVVFYESPESSIESVKEEPLLPHEVRALNFLINEYLMEHNYKLSSITFAEEDDNQDQDFDDWDEVGLNIVKPPSLIKLYRNHYRHNLIHKAAASSSKPSEQDCVHSDLPDILGHAS